MTVLPVAVRFWGTSNGAPRPGTAPSPKGSDMTFEPNPDGISELFQQIGDRVREVVNDTARETGTRNWTLRWTYCTRA